MIVEMSRMSKDLINTFVDVVIYPSTLGVYFNLGDKH